MSFLCTLAWVAVPVVHVLVLVVIVLGGALLTVAVASVGGPVLVCVGLVASTIALFILWMTFIVWWNEKR